MTDDGRNIFLSYPIQNEKQAKPIALGLKASGYNVWTFATDMPSGVSREDQLALIQMALEKSDLFLVILSKHTNRSRGVSSEIVYAQRRNLTIVPLMIESNPEPPINLLSYESLDLTNLLSTESQVNRILDYLQNSINKQTKPKPVSSTLDLANSREQILTKPPVARVFIAYSRQQRDIASKLSQILNTNGIPNFYDAKIKAGATWRQTIQKALDAATHLIVIWTLEAANSDEVEREVSYGLAEGKTIIPLLSKHVSKLPFHLHGLQYIALADDLSAIEEELLNAISHYSEDEDIWQ